MIGIEIVPGIIGGGAIKEETTRGTTKTMIEIMRIGSGEIEGNM